MFSQGKRNDIIRELQILENSTSRPMGEKLNSSEILSEEYSMSSRNISRLLRIDKLIFELKGFVDSGKIAMRSDDISSRPPSQNRSLKSSKKHLNFISKICRSKKMKIGLIDVDRHHFPNIPLMSICLTKLSIFSLITAFLPT